MIAVAFGPTLLVKGGRSTVRRVGFLALSLAIVALCGLLALSAWSASATRSAIIAGRQPRLAVQAQVPSFRFVQTSGTYRGDRWSTLALTPGRVAPPPGLTQFPAPGTRYVSPALANVLRQDPHARFLFPGRVIGEIAPAGVADSRDLFSYVGVAASGLGKHAAGGIGFGVSRDQVAPSLVNPTLVLIELSVILLPAMTVFLLVLLQITAAARTKRSAALRLLGASRTTIASVSATENLVASLLASLGAAALVTVLGGRIAGRLPIVGATVPAATAHPPIAAAVAFLLTLVVVSTWLGWREASRRFDADVLQTRKVGKTGNDSWVRMALLLPGLLPLIVFDVLRLSHRSTLAVGTPYVLALFACALLAIVAAVLAIEPLTIRIARSVASRVNAPPAQIGLRRLAVSPMVGVGLIAGPMACLLVTGIAVGVFAEVRMTSDFGGAELQVTALANASTSNSNVQGLIHAPAQSMWLTSVTEPIDPHAAPSGTPSDIALHAGVPLLFASCEMLNSGGVQALPTCKNGHTYWLVDTAVMRGPRTLSPGMRAHFANRSGGTSTVTVPDGPSPGAGVLVRGIPAESVLITSRAWTVPSLPVDLQATFQVDRGFTSVSNFTRALVSAGPSVQVIGLDGALAAQRNVDESQSLIWCGVVLGLILAAGSLLMTTVDHTRTSARSVAFVRVLGAPARWLRAMQTVQASVPVLLSVSLSLILVLLLTNAFLGAFGLLRGPYLAPLVVCLPLAAVCTAVVLGSAWLAGGQDLRPDDLRSE